MSQNYQILIVDDSRVARMMARASIEKAAPGATIIEADSGDDALGKLEGIDITAGIVDLNMPGMNGLELALELRRRFADIPLALCTANIQEATKQRAKEQNILFIAKPVSPEKIAAFLQESIEA